MSNQKTKNEVGPDSESDFGGTFRRQIHKLINTDETTPFTIGKIYINHTAQIITNHPNLGTDYEILVPAYFALVLNQNREVDYFKIKSNVKDFDKFDDVVVEMQMKDGRALKFAFQLKHKVNENSLEPKNFTTPKTKNPFLIEKYWNFFKDSKNEDKNNYYVILYTNVNFDPACTAEVKNFKMTKNDCCVGKVFFDTSSDFENIYKFDVNENTLDGKSKDHKQFFSKFSFYTGQSNLKGFQDKITDKLGNREVALKYIDLFRRWHLGEFTHQVMDTKTLNIHLIDIILSPFIIENRHITTASNENPKIFEQAVKQFDVTIFDGLKENIIEEFEDQEENYSMDPKNFIELTRDFKIVDKSRIDLKPEEKLKVLYYFCQKPIIIDFNEKSKEFVYKTVELCRVKENEIKLVLLGQDIDTERFSNLEIFKNVNDLHRKDKQLYQEIVDKCQISIQGKDEMSLKKLITVYKEIGDCIETKELLQMLKGGYKIGKARASLPECYIPRKVSTIRLDVKLALDHCIDTKAILIIDGQCENIRDQIEKREMRILDIDTYLQPRESEKDTEQNFESWVIVSKRGCKKIDFDQVCEHTPHHDVHFVKLVDETSFMLLISKNNTLDKLQSGKFSKPETEIYCHFNGPINLVCASPGMGKSTMLNYLSNTCSSECWTVNVDLKSHNSLLLTKPPNDEILRVFFQMENDSEVPVVKNLKTIFFLDGLDELEMSCIDYVLDFIKHLANSGYHVWVSSRQNIQDRTEHTLNVFPIDIEELDEAQQKRYIEDRLKNVYNDEVTTIVTNIYNSTDITNNRSILGIPLQLFMVTQIFLDDTQQYENMKQTNIFVLTKMYRIFFQGKYKFLQQKIQSNNQHLMPGSLRRLLRDYEIPALEVCFSAKIFAELNLDLEENRQILNEIGERGDPLGIITKLNSEGKAVFQHYTYAEYFASTYLWKHFDKVRVLREHLFSAEYQNLMLILNILLAEDCPLHLAVIYKNPDEVDKHLKNRSTIKDKGGRNPLHLACCGGTRHPRLRDKIDNSKVFEGETLANREIIRRLSEIDPFETDKLFELNSLRYSLDYDCLFVFEAVLEKHINVDSFLKGFCDLNIAYYSVQCNYPNLLSRVIYNPDIANIESSKGDSLLHMASRSKIDNIKIVELLVHKLKLDVNRTNHDEETALHILAENGHFEAIKLLIENAANVHLINNRKKTVLHKAAENGSSNIMKLLLNTNVNVNAKDILGKTALHVAVEQKHADAVIDKAADARLTNNKNETVLHAAVKNESSDIMELLFKAAVDVNVKDETGRTALLIAVEEGYSSLVHLLIENSANVSLLYDNNETVLHAAVKNGSPEIMKLLLETVDVNIVNARDESGRTALFVAVNKGYSDVVKLLIENSADVHLLYDNNETVLHAAVRQESSEIMELLLNTDAAINAQDESGKSALMLAAEKEYSSMIKLLIKKKANVRLTNNKEETVLHAAAKNKNPEPIFLLLNNDADVNAKDENGNTALLLAAEQGHYDVVQLLINKGARTNLVNKNNEIALHKAAKNGCPKITKSLLDMETDVNARDGSGRTPLLLAADNLNFAVIKLLIEENADVRIVSNQNQTVLHKAAERGNIELMELFLGMNVDVNVQELTTGKTALMFATHNQHWAAVKLLLEKDANVNCVAKNNLSVLHYAVYKGSIETVKLLLDRSIDLRNVDVNSEKRPLYFAVKDGQLQIDLLLKMTETIEMMFICWNRRPAKIVPYFENYPLY